MKSNTNTTLNDEKLTVLLDYLSAQDITAEPTALLHSFIDPENSLSLQKVEWSPFAKVSDEQQNIKETNALSMGLASMAAVHMLELSEGQSLLDVCAAPGMKSLYAAKVAPGIQLHSNDISFDRIKRMQRLFASQDVDSAVSKYLGQFIDKEFEKESFDRILVDAPCSGEGVILAGDDKMLSTWSQAKVKRLQQLQIKIVKSAWKLLKPGGRMVYATCTLNKNENERVIKKALGVNLDITQHALHLDSLPKLKPNQGWRILPSNNSIGFFIAVIDKTGDSSYDNIYENS